MAQKKRKERYHYPGPHLFLQWVLPLALFLFYHLYGNKFSLRTISVWFWRPWRAVFLIFWYCADVLWTSGSAALIKLTAVCVSKRLRNPFGGRDIFSTFFFSRLPSDLLIRRYYICRLATCGCHASDFDECAAGAALIGGGDRVGGCAFFRYNECSGSSYSLLLVQLRWQEGNEINA